MKIKNIRLINFRNYENLNLPIEKNVNIFIGKNAQGKTNLLEAIYLAASGNSFRTNRDRELLSFNRNPGYVAVDFLSRERERLIEVRLDVLKAKRIKLNRQEIKRLKDLNSGLNVVLFSPDDLELVKGSPGIRRSYLDRSISQIRPVYKHSLSRYNKILYQRNNLLKSKRPNNRDLGLLDVFNMQLVEAGTEIMLYRLEFLENLRDLANSVHSQLSYDSELLDLEYNPSVDLLDFDKKSIRESFNNKLISSRERDIVLGTTSFGPHRDDFTIYLNEKEARVFGSQGQQRTIVLSLKLAEVNMLKYQLGEYPILLLDDVFSELDSSRREYLTRFLKNSQTFITSTDLMDLNTLEDIDIDVFQIEDGKLVNKE